MNAKRSGCRKTLQVDLRAQHEKLCVQLVEARVWLDNNAPGRAAEALQRAAASCLSLGKGLEKLS